MPRSIEELVEAIQSHEAELNRTAVEADRLGSFGPNLTGKAATVRDLSGNCT